MENYYELEYENLPIEYRVGPPLPFDPYANINTIDVDYVYKVPMQDLVEFCEDIVYHNHYEKENAAIWDALMDIEDEDEHWKYLESKLDYFMKEYNQKILDHFEDDAAEDFCKRHDPRDLIDYYDESYKRNNVKMKLDTKLFEEIDNVGTFEEKNRGVASVAYADAAKDFHNKKAQAAVTYEKHRKEVLKGTDDMNSTISSRTKYKVPKTEPLKRMHLSEALFDDYIEDELDKPESCDETLNESRVSHPQKAIDVVLKATEGIGFKKKQLEEIENAVSADPHFDNIYELFLNSTHTALGDATKVVKNLHQDERIYVLDPFGPGYIKFAFKEDFDKNPFVKNESVESVTDDTKLTESLDARSPESTGVANILNGLIIDEFETIDAYNSAIATIKDFDANSPMIAVLEDILKEENIHVGQLQAALTTVSEAAHDIKTGDAEGKDQLGEPTVDAGEPTTDKPTEIKSDFEQEHIG